MGFDYSSTEERVAQMLAAVKRDPQDDRRHAASLGAVTVEKSYQRGHGGLFAQYMPVLIAVSPTDPKLNLYALQATRADPRSC
jgi:hypothetical protein